MSALTVVGAAVLDSPGLGAAASAVFFVGGPALKGGSAAALALRRAASRALVAASLKASKVVRSFDPPGPGTRITGLPALLTAASA